MKPIEFSQYLQSINFTFNNINDFYFKIDELKNSSYPIQCFLVEETHEYKLFKLLTTNYFFWYIKVLK